MELYAINNFCTVDGPMGLFQLASVGFNIFFNVALVTLYFGFLCACFVTLYGKHVLCVKKLLLEKIFPNFLDILFTLKNNATHFYICVASTTVHVFPTR